MGWRMSFFGLCHVSFVASVGVDCKHGLAVSVWLSMIFCVHVTVMRFITTPTCSGRAQLQGATRVDSAQGRGSHVRSQAIEGAGSSTCYQCSQCQQHCTQHCSHRWDDESESIVATCSGCLHRPTAVHQCRIHGQHARQRGLTYNM